VRGAFTGATNPKDGLLAIAEGGTVFLDEIGELPTDLQAKLLRAIQEKEIRPSRQREARSHQRPHSGRDQSRFGTRRHRGHVPPRSFFPL
jgi:transcriptional regulator with AAA-type ATPase domain